MSHTHRCFAISAVALLASSMTTVESVMCTSPQATTTQVPTATNNYRGVIFSSADWQPSTNATLTPEVLHYDCSWNIQCPESTEFAVSTIAYLFSDGSDQSTATSVLASNVSVEDRYAQGDDTFDGSSIQFEYTGNTSRSISMAFAAICTTELSVDTKPFSTLRWQYSTQFKEEGFELEYFCHDSRCHGSGERRGRQRSFIVISIFVAVVLVVVIGIIVYCCCLREEPSTAANQPQLGQVVVEEGGPQLGQVVVEEGGVGPTHREMSDLRDDNFKDAAI